MRTRHRPAIRFGIVAGSVGLLASAAGCSSAPPAADARFLAEWMETHYALARVERASPPVVSRVLAYSAVALYEGLVPGSPTLRTLAGQLNGLERLPEPERGKTYDWPIVAVAAETTVLGTLYAEGFSSTKVAIAELAHAHIAARTAQGVSRTVRERSEAYGAQLGKAITEWAATDGFLDTRGRPYTLPQGRQYWVNTSTEDQYIPQSISAASDIVSFENPAAMFEPSIYNERAILINRPKLPGTRTLPSVSPLGATEPYWGELRPFALRSADECAPPPPAPYEEYSASDFDRQVTSEDSHWAFYKQVKAVYDVSKALTEDQWQIALFWADNPGQTGTPPGHWVSIMSQLVEQLHLDVDQAAEMFALTAVGMADAFISCWREKYRSHVVRPVTAIRRFIDPSWQTTLVTPPFPEYTSGHSVQSAAAAEVLTGLFGDVPFSDNTHVSLGHPVKRFASFRAAAEEAAISRLYGGIHYPMAIDNGVAQGRCIGRKVIERVKTRRSP